MAFIRETAKWFSQITRSSSDPSQVREINSSEFVPYAVRKREEGLVLYGPIPKPAQKDTPALDIFEIVVHSKSASTDISLFRCPDANEAEDRFVSYLKIIPVFLEARPELYNKGSLQKLCDAARENPSWSASHIAVSLDMADLVANPSFEPSRNSLDESGLTPLMLATRLGSKHITSAVLASGARLEVGQECATRRNVFHLAANTTASIVDILAITSGAPEDLLKRLLNKKDGEGSTPLQLACAADKPDVVLAMMSAGADVNGLDSSLRSTGEKPEAPVADLPKKVAEDGPGPSTNTTTQLESEDGDSSTAVVREMPKSASSASSATVREVLKTNASQIYTKDIRTGGTLLHWATEKPTVEAFIELGCNIHARDYEGRTALHVMLKHKRLPCVVSLLGHGARVQDTDSLGNTALHAAAYTGQIPLLKAILVFDGDFNARNEKGETAWDIILTNFQSKIYNNMDKERQMMLYTLAAVGASGPAALAVDGPAAAHKEFDWRPALKENERTYKRARHLFDEFLDQIALNATGAKTKDGLRILALDGGGIRGLVLTKILSALEDQAGRPILQLFDWVGGTSTGGILTLALALGKTTRQCQALYFRLKDQVFIGKRPYEVGPLEALLKKEFGENTTMGILPPSPRILVTGVMSDRHPADLHFFRNFPSPAHLLGIKEDLPPGLAPSKPYDQQEIWQAARCSGAAPTYFRAAGRFIDGGLISNNPTLDLLTEVHEMNCVMRALGREAEVRTVGVVVSAGTGDTPLETVDSMDLFRPDSILNVPQLFFVVSAMGRLLLDQVCSTVNRVVDRARAWCGMANIPYVRLSPQLDQDVRMDETDDEVLVHMLWLTQSYMVEQKYNVEKLIKLLVDK